MKPHFLYFAYGSNLLSSRLRARTASARVVGREHRHRLAQQLGDLARGEVVEQLLLVGVVPEERRVADARLVRNRAHRDAFERLSLEQAQERAPQARARTDLTGVGRA